MRFVNVSEAELKKFILNYEIKSRIWTGFIGNSFLQNLFAKYFAWKVNRKFRRFKECEKIGLKLNSLKNQHK